MPPSLAVILAQFLELLPQETSLYLVGGAVRDILRGEALHDLDLVMSGDVLATSRRLADAIGAAYYPLDEARQTARIVQQAPDGARITIDIASCRGPDLETDLRGRDFTINAIALDTRQPERLIDPLGGARDLHEKRLRACSPSVLGDDPVRVVRAVRFAVHYKLQIEPQTQGWMRQAAGRLGQVSAERRRDELFRILGGVDVAVAVRVLDRFEALEHLLPELVELKGISQSSPHVQDVWGHTLDVSRSLSNLMDILGLAYNPDQGGNLALGLLALRLGRYRSQFSTHLSEPFTPDRGVRPLLALAGLYHDIAKPQTRETDAHGRIRFLEHDQLGAEVAANRASALRLSLAEIEYLKRTVRHHMRPMLLAQADQLPSRRAIYRFFRDTGKAGVGVCMLSLADFLGTYGSALPQDAWSHQLDVIRTLLEAWWENPAPVITPPPLVNGRQLMEKFGLSPGPQIGKILEAIQEAQAGGEVVTLEQALELAGRIISGE
jgi:putative nucleotidyltransferase with HDIG domain